jgi:hypothetical protein
MHRILRGETLTHPACGTHAFLPRIWPPIQMRDLTIGLQIVTTDFKLIIGSITVVISQQLVGKCPKKE